MNRRRQSYQRARMSGLFIFNLVSQISLGLALGLLVTLLLDHATR